MYSFFPWEDFRKGRRSLIDQFVAPSLADWSRSATDPIDRRNRQERADICFGLHGATWDGYRVLERYELLYEAGLVYESWSDQQSTASVSSGSSPTGDLFVSGFAMSFDHRRIAATALGRLRGKIRFRPVIFELLPDEFTLLQLQQVVESLAGVGLHKQNFRRLVEQGGLVEGTGRVNPRTGGRPAELFRFRREVLRERPTPGVGLPSLKS